jgi:DGQHR domain-containing protein
MFARVNLSQTPVNPSLVYDLFELAKSRSPQKFTHEITVKLDRTPGGPFQRRIKRLGTATRGRDREFLTQATVVKGMLQLISDNPDVDRDFYLRHREPPRPSRRESERLIFRGAFLEGKDDLVFEAVTNLFTAVRERWPIAWEGAGDGYILPRTNGYLALMRYLRDATIYFSGPDTAVPVERHMRLLERVPLRDGDITSERFLPGTSGEAALYRELTSVIPR